MPENQNVDLKLLTIKEHLILLNEKMRDIKEDTEALKKNDIDKWKAIRSNERRLDEVCTSVKIYIAIFGVIFASAVTVFWQTIKG